MIFSVFFQHGVMAFKELTSNKLRTFLSLLGVTIGVFCIISVLTVFDSLQKNIQSNMQSLGSNIMYIGKYPWIPEEEGEYPMWKYKARPVCNKAELKAIEKNVSSAAYATLCYTDEAESIKFQNNEVKGASVFAVTYDFNKLQAIEIETGRYFSVSEMQGTQSNGILIGSQLADELFGNSINPINKSISLLDRKYTVIGVLKKQGKTMTGFDFDAGVILSYNYLSAYRNIDNNIGNGFTDPLLMVRSKDGYDLKEMKYEIKSVMRAIRKLRPIEKDNFSFNQLSTIQSSIDAIFVNFNVFGFIIGFFSLLVGSFGIANIMFVSVKERTTIIGIKKAIGAKSDSILAEFLIESTLLCLGGGFIGIILVYILSKILSGPVGFPITMSLFNFLLGIFISIFVGIIAGYLPAKRAAHLNPVVAIRS
jgi:putative ABC transport system permease protein